jgi:hypothetical protein
MSLIHVSLREKEYEEVEAYVYASFPEACIVSIDRVENPSLQERFDALKAHIETKRGFCHVKRMYHGTRASAVGSIISGGFKTSYNKASAFGRGTYFATAASYSKHYTRPNHDDESFLLLCDVLEGVTIQYGCNEPIDTEKHDNSSAPGILVTPYDSGAIPRYLVRFHANAK